jgi:hypothetical protein
MEEFDRFLYNSNKQLLNYFDKYNIYDDIEGDENFNKGFTCILPNNSINTIMEKSKDTKIARLIKSMIISGYFPNMSSWRKINNTIDMNGNLVTLLSSRGSTVILNSKSGRSSITLVKTFDTDNPIAIYQLSEDSELPGIEQSSSETKINNKKNMNNNFRKELENKFLNTRNLDYFCLHNLSSFLYYLNSNNKKIFDGLIHLLDYNPISNFMIIFEIYKNDGYFIDTDIINNWYINEIDAPTSYYYNILYKHRLILPKEFISDINSLRLKLINTRSVNNKIHILNEIYDNLTNNNTIGKCKLVYTNETLDLLKKASFYRNIKAEQDEIRAVVDNIISSGTKNIAKDIIYHSKLVPRIFNENITNSFTVSQVNEVINQFINSTYFLSFRISNCDFGGTAKEYDESSSDSGLIDPITYYYKQNCLEKYENEENEENDELNDLLAQIKICKAKKEQIPENIKKRLIELTNE